MALPVQGRVEPAVAASSAIPGMIQAMEINGAPIVLTRHRIAYADVLIAPATGQMFWADFKAINRCMEAGRKAYNEAARLGYCQKAHIETVPAPQWHGSFGKAWRLDASVSFVVI